MPYGMSTERLYGWSSFPSDHAILFMALAVAIFLASRRFGWLALTYTTLCIIGPRVYLGWHWPTDVLAGALLGAAFAAERYGVVPDMINFAKGVTNAAVPLGGTIVSNKVHYAFMSGPEHGIEQLLLELRAADYVPGTFLVLLLGALVAAFAGSAALRILRAALAKRLVAAFAIYLVPLGIATLAWGYARP